MNRAKYYDFRHVSDIVFLADESNVDTTLLHEPSTTHNRGSEEAV